MKLLLDTHVFLWFIAGAPQLSAIARQLIEDPNNEPFLSVGSVWEMAIKVNLGKLTLSQPFDNLIPQQIQLNGIQLPDLHLNHAAVVATLPFHHRDPFDRLLIAQAMVEQIPIVSADTAFDAYGVQRMW
jgi:PIN domain nuclease of toxin-antitoxin system